WVRGIIRERVNAGRLIVGGRLDEEGPEGSIKPIRADLQYGLAHGRLPRCSLSTLFTYSSARRTPSPTASWSSESGCSCSGNSRAVDCSRKRCVVTAHGWVAPGAGGPRVCATSDSA